MWKRKWLRYLAEKKEKKRKEEREEIKKRENYRSLEDFSRRSLFVGEEDGVEGLTQFEI